MCFTSTDYMYMHARFARNESISSTACLNQLLNIIHKYIQDEVLAVNDVKAENKKIEQ